MSHEAETQTVTKLILYKGRPIEVFIDKDDEELYEKYAWFISKHGDDIEKYYVAAKPYDPETKKGKTLYLHRLLMAPPPDKLVDHLSRDPMDNTRKNLRIVGRKENAANSGKRRTWRGRPTSSIYKGVSWSNKKRKWLAKITYGETQEYLGYFTSQVDAAKVYDARARKLHGEYAYLNSPAEPQSTVNLSDDSGAEGDARTPEAERGRTRPHRSPSLIRPRRNVDTADAAVQ